MREGRAALADLPAADQLWAIMPACDVSLLATTIPPLSGPKLRQALPNLLEDMLVQEAQQCHFAIQPSPTENGLPTVAVVDRAWLRFLTDMLAAHTHRHLHIVPAQLCLPWEAGQAPALSLAQPPLALSETPFPPLPVDTATIRTGTNSGYGLRLAADSGISSLLETETFQVVYSSDKSLPPPWMADRVPPAQALNWSNWITGARCCPIDLCQFEFAPQRFARHLQGLRAWRWPITLTVLIGLVQLAGMNLEYGLLKQEKKRLQHTMEDTLRAAAPSLPVIVDPPLQLRRHVEALRTASGKLSDSDFAVLAERLAQLTRSLPPDALQTLEYRSSVLYATFTPTTPTTDLAQRAPQFGLTMVADTMPAPASNSQNALRWRLQAAP